VLKRIFNNKIVTKESYNKTVFIFKHSTRCAISSLAKNRLESDWAKYFNEKEVYFLDLLRFRELSNQVETQLNIQHQSPQLIALESGKSVYKSSHLAISVKDLHQVLTEH